MSALRVRTPIALQVHSEKYLCRKTYTSLEVYVGLNLTYCSTIRRLTQLSDNTINRGSPHIIIGTPPGKKRIYHFSCSEYEFRKTEFMQKIYFRRCHRRFHSLGLPPLSFPTKNLAYLTTFTWLPQMHGLSISFPLFKSYSKPF